MAVSSRHYQANEIRENISDNVSMKVQLNQKSHYIPSVAQEPSSPGGFISSDHSIQSDRVNQIGGKQKRMTMKEFKEMVPFYEKKSAFQKKRDQKSQSTKSILKSKKRSSETPQEEDWSIWQYLFPSALRRLVGVEKTQKTSQVKVIEPSSENFFRKVCMCGRKRRREDIFEDNGAEDEEAYSRGDHQIPSQSSKFRFQKQQPDSPLMMSQRSNRISLQIPSQSVARQSQTGFGTPLHDRSLHQPEFAEPLPKRQKLKEGRNSMGLEGSSSQRSYKEIMNTVYKKHIHYKEYYSKPPQYKSMVVANKEAPDNGANISWTPFSSQIIDTTDKPTQLAVFADTHRQQPASDEEAPVPESQLLNLNSETEKTQKSFIGGGDLGAKMESQDRIDITNQIQTDHSQIDSTFKREQSQPAPISSMPLKSFPSAIAEQASPVPVEVAAGEVNGSSESPLKKKPANQFGSFGGTFRQSRVEKPDVEMTPEEPPAQTASAPSKDKKSPSKKQPHQVKKEKAVPLSEEMKKNINMEVQKQNLSIVAAQMKLKQKQLGQFKIHLKQMTDQQMEHADQNGGQANSSEKTNGKAIAPPQLDSLTEPEEDEKADFSLPSLNKEVAQRLFKEHLPTFQEIAGMESGLLDILSSKMNQNLMFFKHPIKVVSAQQLLNQDKWSEFLKAESKKYKDSKYELTVVLTSPTILAKPSSSSSMSTIDLMMITPDKICTISFRRPTSPTTPKPVETISEETNSLWQQRKRTLFEMMNKKVEPEMCKVSAAPLFPFMKAEPAPAAEDLGTFVEVVEKEAEEAEDIIETSEPLFCAFGFYRYYIFNQKYKAIVKFNLDHPRYFDKRDELQSLCSSNDFEGYWQGCLLSFLKV